MKTDSVIRYQKMRYQQMSEKLLSVVHGLYAAGLTVSVRKVARIAGVARITVYRHTEIMDLIRAYRSG